MKAGSPLKARRASILRAAGTLIALGLLVYLLSQQGWREIGEAIQRIPAWRFVLAIVLMLLSRLAVSARWHVLLRSGEVDIPFSQTTRLTFAGLFASNFLPTTIGGDVFRLAGSMQLKYEGALCAASLMADRLIGMVGMAMALPFGIPTIAARGLSMAPAFSSHGPVTAGAFAPLVKRLSPYWERGKRSLMRLINGLKRALALWIKQPTALLASLAFSWVHMLCLFASMYILLQGMSESMSLWLIGGLWSVIYFVTLAPISINGYGLQEVSLVFIFTRFGGVSDASALTLAILVRTLFMLASLPGAVFVPAIMAGRDKASQQIGRLTE
jgi:uncharacterized membrane protein YbhN (UPF0104 family)